MKNIFLNTYSQRRLVGQGLVVVATYYLSKQKFENKFLGK
jgi:hypothetical protein